MMTKTQKSGCWNTLVLLCLLLVPLLVSCTSNSVTDDVSQWVEYSFNIDADVKLQLKLPYSKFYRNNLQPEYIVTKSNPISKVFDKLYDPGWGRDRDILLTHISAIVVRVERNGANDSALSLEEYKAKFLLEGKESDPRFEFEPVHDYYGREWLKADLLGWPNGVSYSTLLHGDLVLKIAMTMFKDDANETQLFQQRLKTMEQILSTVEISVVEIR